MTGRGDSPRLKRSATAREVFEAASGLAAEAARAQILAWLAAVHDKERRVELRARLNSSDNVSHYSSRWEITLDGLFRDAGFEITYPEPLEAQSTRMDFLIGCGPSGFFCEATLVQDEAVDQRQNRRLAEVADALDTIVAPFHVLMFVRAPIPDDLRTRNVRTFLVHELGKLDAANQQPVQIVYFDARGDREPRITFQVVPSSGAAGPVIAGWAWDQARMLGVFLRIRRALAYKASKYGVLDRPYTIALWDHTQWSLDGDELERALFGDLQVVFSEGPEAPRDLRTQRARNGFFTGRKSDGSMSNRHVSAVIFYRGRLTESSAEHQLFTYHNPHALRPLDPDCLPGHPQFVPRDNGDGTGHMSWINGSGPDDSAR